MSFREELNRRVRSTSSAEYEDYHLQVKARAKQLFKTEVIPGCRRAANRQVGLNREYQFVLVLPDGDRRLWNDLLRLLKHLAEKGKFQLGVSFGHPDADQPQDNAITFDWGP